MASPSPAPVSRAPWTIHLEDVCAGYGRTIVIEHLTDTFPGGQITAILGGSGCGKSTLLRHILGLQALMSGSIYLDGHNISQMNVREFKKMRRRMGVLFQDGALLGALTLEENVGLPLAEHTDLSPGSIHDVVLYKLSLVGLEDFASYYPGELSGGMRKRAGLARALVMDPPLLLCDEPTSGLDPLNAAQMDELLLTLKAQFPDMTIVVVCHDLASVRMIADHVLMLGNRTTLFAGTKKQLYDNPDPYVQRFLNRQPPEGGITPRTPPAAAQVEQEDRVSRQDSFGIV